MKSQANPFNMYIAASAGSGKTYQLVNRFIGLLCMQYLRDHKIEVKRLMAITFTRKAAAEFKSRILSSLAQASASPEAAAEFWDERVDVTLRQFAANYQRPNHPQAIFLSILRDVMAQFGQLQLSTIDSLLERMLRGLEPELGISNIRIMDPIEETMYRRKTLNASYLKNQSLEDMSNLADSFSDSQKSDGAMSSPDRALMELIKDHHKNYIKSPDALWGGRSAEMSDAQLAEFGLSRADVTSCLSEDAHREMIERLRGLLAHEQEFFPAPTEVKEQKNCYTVGNHPMEINMSKVNQKSYRKYFTTFAHSLCQLNDDLMLPKKNKFYVNPSLAAMESEYYPAYWDICRQNDVNLNALSQSHDGWRWQQVLMRTQSIAHIIESFERTYEQEVRQSGTMGFDDIANLIQNRVEEFSLAKLQERIDLNIEHWMLDEFQDTSHQQYAILLNLLHSRSQLGDDGSVFMVGDTKQSIYQFRGGDPEIFIKARDFLVDESDQLGEESSQCMSLNKSYRSAPEVLELSNMLFGADCFAKLASLSLPASREQWAKFNYKEHLSNRPDLRGCAEIWQMLPGGKNFALPEYGSDDILLHGIAAKLAQLRPKDSVNPPSCAILVRSNNNGKKTQERLLELQDIYGFEGPIMLNAKKQVGMDSLLGVALIEFFCWLNTPGDKHSLKLLQLSPLWQRIEELGGLNSWASLRELWTNKGCYALLLLLFDGAEFLLVTNDFLHQRKKIWLEEASRFDAVGGNLSEWITHMRELVKNEQSQGNEISIMTIHQAKGLEFDFVFFPVFSPCKAFTDLTTAKLLTRRDAEGQDLSVILRPSKALHERYPNFEKCMLEPRFVNEELGGYCQLYVAITRAKMASYIMLPPPSKDPKEESFATLLHKLSEQLPAPSDKDELHHHDGETLLAQCTLRLGDTEWYLQRREPREAEEPAAMLEPVLDYRFRSLPRSTPSGLDRDRQQDDAAPLMPRLYPLSEGKGAAFGSLVHGLFEQVSWLGEPLPEGADVDELALSTITRALRSAAWEPYFRRPEAEFTLYREQNIECIIKGQWVSGQIDRMLVCYDHGRQAGASSAHIMDFKTDANLTEAAGKDHYRAQMRAYRLMVAQAFGLNLHEVTVSLLHCPAEGEPAAWSFAEDEWA